MIRLTPTMELRELQEWELRGKPFVTARRAAELIGCSEAAVIHDIEEGMDGALPALIGGRYGEAWVVNADQLEGAALLRHRARLADRETDDAAH